MSGLSPASSDPGHCLVAQGTERNGRSSRRMLLKGAAAVALARRGVTSAAEPDKATPATTTDADRGAAGIPRLRKALSYSMLPASRPMEERLKLAADLGFHGVEVSTLPDDETLKPMRAAADRAGISIHSVLDAASWDYPLSSSDPGIVGQGREALRQSLHQAKALGADTVLLVPAVVTPQVRYQEAWERSQREIRGVLPLARELGVTIAVENVGNRFLLSPLEFARYVDEFNDPFLQAYFDIGNSLMLWGYPQDWILTLGRRIRKLHLKDCQFGKKQFVLLRDGDVDWPAVCRAIERIGFRGFLTVEPNYRSPELERGDAGYLKEIARRVDLILEGR